MSNKWKPISTAPRDGTRVMLVNARISCGATEDDYPIYSGKWGQVSQWQKPKWVGSGSQKVTHWMELPEHPKKQGAQA